MKNKKINDLMFDHVQEQFRSKLPEALTREFGNLGFKTEWNIFVGSFGGVVTNWKKKVTPKKQKEIKEFIRVYEKAFMDTANIAYFFLESTVEKSKKGKK